MVSIIHMEDTKLENTVKVKDKIEINMKKPNIQISFPFKIFFSMKFE